MHSVYGADLVFSREFHEDLSYGAQSCCRPIDFISFPLHSDKIDLYTFDTVTKGLKSKVAASQLKGKDLESSYYEDDHKISLLGGSPIINHRYIHENEVDFEVDLAVQALQWDLHDYFLPLSRRAVNLYKCGKWHEAKELYEYAFQLQPGEKEGPSSAAYARMEIAKFEAGEDWDGYRVLS